MSLATSRGASSRAAVLPGAGRRNNLPHTSRSAPWLLKDCWHFCPLWEEEVINRKRADPFWGKSSFSKHSSVLANNRAGMEHASPWTVGCLLPDLCTTCGSVWTSHSGAAIFTGPHRGEDSTGSAVCCTHSPWRHCPGLGREGSLAESRSSVRLSNSRLGTTSHS